VSLQRLLKSIAWKLIPYAELNFQLPSGLHFSVRDKGSYACLNELWVQKTYDSFFSKIGKITGWVDIGCNVGFFSMALEDSQRERYGKADQRSALLIDANEQCVGATKSLLEQNRLSNIESYHAVIGPKGETVAFHQFKHSVTSRIMSSQKGEKIYYYKTTPLVEIIGDWKGPFDLIKVDVEGAEKYVFEQEQDQLLRFKYGLCEWHEPYTNGKLIMEFCERNSLEVIFLKSQYPEWSPGQKDTLDSSLGMIGWANPSPIGGN
jgi:FkbM family methyltransferase